MPVKIRLMRLGSRKRPFYRVVAVDERKKRTGGYLELLGTYNPLTKPKEIILKQDKIDDWIKKGAVLSDGFLRITGKAPQRLPRKPKKAKVEPQQSTQPTETPTTQTDSSADVVEETASIQKTTDTTETPLENTEPEDSTAQPESTEKAEPESSN